MKPLEFKDQNTMIAKDQEDYQTLPAYIASNPQGEVNVKIEVTPEEIAQIAEQGYFWFNMWCFNKAVTPIRFQPTCTIIDWQPLIDFSVKNLNDSFLNGTVISNEESGKDAIIMVIDSIAQDVVTINVMNIHTLKIIDQRVRDFKGLKNLFEVSTLKGKWFYANGYKSGE